MGRNELRIAVIGGSIGGPILAFALRQRGIAAEVYEQAAELSEIDAAVALSANAMRELRRIGVLDELLAVATERAKLIFRDGRDGSRIAAHPVRQGGRYRQRFGAPYLGIHRADLQRILAGVAAGGLEAALDRYRALHVARARKIQRSSRVTSDLRHRSAVTARNRRMARLPADFGWILEFDVTSSVGQHRWAVGMPALDAGATTRAGMP